MHSLMLCLIFLHLLGVFAPSVPSPNLALHKYTEQSSTHTIYGSSRCNDGNTMMWHAECCQTLGSDPWNWWMVDLGQNETIKSIRITNINCCRYSLYDYSIEITTENPKTMEGFPGPVANASVCLYQVDKPPHTPTSYRCQQPITGRYVRIVMENLDYVKMFFCELEVYAHYEGNYTVHLPSRDNIALNKPTSHSSSIKSWLAVDGFLDPQARYCYSSTDAGNPPHWWMVDLEKVYVIETFRIVNRAGSYQQWLRNFTIEVSVDDPNSFAGFPWRTTQATECLTQIDQIHYNVPIILKCDRPLLGRYIRIVKEIPEIIVICEFEVFDKQLGQMAYAGGSQVLAGSVNENSLEARRYMTSCARQFMRSISALQYYELTRPFIHVDLEDGKCRYLENYQDSKGISSSSWVVYRYEQIEGYYR